MAQAGTAREFINAVIALEREYGLTLSHEDVHGAFLIEPFSELNVEWLRQSRCASPRQVYEREQVRLPKTPWRRDG